MCQNRNSKNVYIYDKSRYVRVDACIAGLVTSLQTLGIKTLSCCCGHNRYPMSLVVSDKEGRPLDLFSGWLLRNKRRFYEKDTEGYYHLASVPPYILRDRSHPLQPLREEKSSSSTEEKEA